MIFPTFLQKHLDGQKENRQVECLFPTVKRIALGLFMFWVYLYEKCRDCKY